MCHADGDESGPGVDPVCLMSELSRGRVKKTPGADPGRFFPNQKELPDDYLEEWWLKGVAWIPAESGATLFFNALRSTSRYPSGLWDH